MTFIDTGFPEPLLTIKEKVFQQERLLPEEGLLLYEKAEPGFLSMLAEQVRKHRNFGADDRRIDRLDQVVDGAE